jgi:hypothetical protein
MQLPQDFKEFIELMISTNVRFVMIGGYAYNLYRNPRATGDIDFSVGANKNKKPKLHFSEEFFETQRHRDHRGKAESVSVKRFFTVASASFRSHDSGDRW